ncbi:membrane protein of unknown function [Streptomyces sp. KY75]|nr:membrane protein of unknown function [Streptomyces sp. KY75]
MPRRAVWWPVWRRWRRWAACCGRRCRACGTFRCTCFAAWPCCPSYGHRCRVAPGAVCWRRRARWWRARCCGRCLRSRRCCWGRSSWSPRCAGAPDGFRGALGESMRWSESAAAPVVLAVVAGLLGAAYRWWPSLVRVAAPLVTPGATARGAAGAGALALGWGGALLLAAATLGVPYPVAVALETVLVAGLLLVAVRGAELGAGDAGTGEGGGAGAGAGLRAVAGPPWR